jgi:hypothetical protein
MEKIKAPVVIKESAALTAAYTGWVAEPLYCLGMAEVELLLDVTKGDATSIEIKTDVESREGTSYYPRWAPSDGTAALDVISIPLASLSATDRVAIRVDVRSAAKLRVSAKRTGGATASLAIKAIGGGP